MKKEKSRQYAPKFPSRIKKMLLRKALKREKKEDYHV